MAPERRPRRHRIHPGLRSNDTDPWPTTGSAPSFRDPHPVPVAFEGGQGSYPNAYTETQSQATLDGDVSFSSRYGSISADWMSGYPAEHSSSSRRAPLIGPDIPPELDTDLSSIPSFSTAQLEASNHSGYDDTTHGLSRDYLDMHTRGPHTQFTLNTSAFHSPANFPQQARPRQVPSAPIHSPLPSISDRAGTSDDVGATSSATVNYHSFSTAPPSAAATSYTSPAYGPQSFDTRAFSVTSFTEHQRHNQGSGYPSIPSAHPPIQSPSTVRPAQQAYATPIAGSSHQADYPHVHPPYTYFGQAYTPALPDASWPRPAPEPRAYCGWGGACNAPLDDVTAAGLARHLRDAHFPGAWSNTHRGACCFVEHGHTCGREMDFASFGKHIASVHLKSTSRVCADCGKEFGRGDSLARHRKTCHGA